MSPTAEPDAPFAVVCGSDSLVGNALLSRLRRARWRIVTIDPPGAVERRRGDQTPRPLEDRQQRSRRFGSNCGMTKCRHGRSFTRWWFPGPDSPCGTGQKSQDTAIRDLVDGGTLGCEHVMPLMSWR